jgi:periplasmic divalent cation tolerance protein
MHVRFVYMTAGNLEEAQKIGRELVSAGLAACVNILPHMNSIYVWEGKLEEASEVVMIAKTVEARVADLIARVKSLHSYGCPCIVSLKVEDGYPPFLEWVAETVKT